MSVLEVLVDSNRYDGPIWSAWRATCALCVLLSLLKILTLGDHTAYGIDFLVN